MRARRWQHAVRLAWPLVGIALAAGPLSGPLLAQAGARQHERAAAPSARDSSPGTAPASTATQRDAGAAIDSLIRHAQARVPLAGVSALVVRTDAGARRPGPDTVFAGAHGVADRAAATPATLGTRYHFGSVGKQFTAAAVMQLAERGRLSLDDTITRYVPEYPEGAGRTLRHLLGMQSGIPNYTKDTLVRRDTTLTDAEVIAAVRRQPLVFEPGARYQYSNSNYHLLGMVVARVAGRPFRSYLAQEVLPRASTRELYTCAAPAAGDPGRARSYGALGDSLVPLTDMPSSVPVDYGFGAGSVCGSVRGLVAWATALADGRVVSRASYAQMTTPGRLRSGAPTPYGFGFFVDTVAGHQVAWHAGLIPAYEGYIAHYLRDGIIVGLATNTVNARTEAAQLPALGNAVGERALGVADSLRLSDAERARLVGTYAIGPRMVHIRDNGGQIVAVVGDQAPIELTHRGGGAFRPLLEPTIVFQFGAGQPHAKSLRVRQAGQIFDGQRVSPP